MKKNKLAALREATDAKLRYAQLYLDAIKDPKIAATDEEKAHQESFVFHLVGAVDAFFAEFNELFELGIKDKHLTIENLKSAKYSSKKTAREGKKLSKLLGKKSWVDELRSFSPEKQKSAEKKSQSKEQPEANPLTGEPSPISANPILDKFEEWQAKMRNVVVEFRDSAKQASEKVSKK
jgi:predicted Ser/Thr protein kinase